MLGFGAVREAMERLVTEISYLSMYMKDRAKSMGVLCFL